MRMWGGGQARIQRLNFMISIDIAQIQLDTLILMGEENMVVLVKFLDNKYYKGI